MQKSFSAADNWKGSTIEDQLNPIGIDLTLDTKFKKLIKSNNVSIDPINEYST